MNDRHSAEACGAIQDAAYMIRHRMEAAICDYQAPHVMMRPKVFLDGDSWCALYGENIQEGVCGFGDTPADAVNDFNNCWNGWGKYAKDKPCQK